MNALSSDVVAFGNKSLKCTHVNSSTLASFPFTGAVTTTYTITGYVFIPSTWDGGAISINTANFSGATTTVISTATAVDTWTRIETRLGIAADATGSIVIQAAGSPSNGAFIYLDAVQVEAKDHATTYVDGDQDGCAWVGVPHASVSVRPIQSYQGGVIKDLHDDYHFPVEQMQATGMPPVENILSERAVLDGSEFQRSRTGSRTMQLVSTIIGANLQDYHSKRRELIKAVSKPFVLQYEGSNEPKRIQVHYASGLDLQGPTGFNETVALRLLAANDPYWKALLENVASLGTTSATFRLVAHLNPSSGWDNMGPPHASGTYTRVTDLFVKSPTEVIVVGVFENFDNIANADYIARYNNGAWSAVGNPNSGGASITSVESVCCDAAGHIIMGGNFTNIAGNSNCDHVARWDGFSWTALTPNISTGASGTGIRVVRLGPDGYIYAGGNMTNMANNANNDYIAYYDGNDWLPLGTGMNGAVYDIAWDSAGNLYAGGAFTTAGGVIANRIAKWNGSTWSAVGGGVNSTVTSIVVDRNNNVYFGGNFTIEASTTKPLPYVAMWNGASLTSLGSGLNNTVSSMAVGADGTTIMMGGTFTTAGGKSVQSPLVAWTGSTFLEMGIQLPASSVVGGLASGYNQVYIGFDKTGTAYHGGPVTFENEGTANAWPIITIRRTSGSNVTLNSIANLTTGKQLFFDLLMAQDGQELVIDLRPGRRRMYSNVSYSGSGSAQDDHWLTLPGSDVAEFYLAPGENTLALYATPSAPANLEVYVRWQNTDWSVD